MFRGNICKSICLLSLILGVFILSGCGGAKDEKIAKVFIAIGDEQCTFPGEEFPGELHIRVDGLKSNPLSNKTLTLTIVDGSDLKISEETIVTDAGGIAKVKVGAGRKTGDNYLKITPVDAPEKAITARFITGIKIIGNDQEGQSGNKLSEPFGVKVVDANGEPLAGVPVYFSTESRMKIAKTELVTDKNGEALTDIVLPEKTGEGKINIEIGSSEIDNMLRTIHARALSLNVYSIIVNVLGGLALFIFGMTLMSDGLTMIAGDRMRSILHFCARNRVVAVIAGALVTATIQSSSATTVMVIGFVNAGLLSLSQSIGIIFGANIGTTVTAQIVAFDISTLAIPAIVLGLVVSFVKWQKVRGWGGTILGFGLLFFGMSMMSADLKSISVFPSFKSFFQTFDCAPIDGSIPLLPLLGAICIGMIATMIVQSSSAASGVVIALGASGLINLYTAIALILGSNIGTTITAQLAAIPANKVAKQTALAHTLFNIIGVVLITSTFWINWPGTHVPFFFYIVNRFTDGNVFADVPQNLPRHIANAHTLFNVITTLVLLPFVKTFATLCSRILPVGDKKIKYQYLEPHLLDTPSLALEQSVFALRKMLVKSWKIVDRAINEHFIPVDLDETKVAALSKREKRVDRYQLEIQEYLSMIMRRKLTQEQTSMIPPLMHCTNDAERIADRGGNMVTLAGRLKTADVKLSDEGERDLIEIYNALRTQAVETLLMLERPESKKISHVLSIEKEIDRMANDFEDAHIVRLNSGKCEVITGIIFVELLSEIVAVSRHFSNIAERAMALKGAPYKTLPKKPAGQIKTPAKTQ